MGNISDRVLEWSDYGAVAQGNEIESVEILTLEWSIVPANDENSTQQSSSEKEYWVEAERPKTLLFIVLKEYSESLFVALQIKHVAS